MATSIRSRIYQRLWTVASQRNRNFLVGIGLVLIVVLLWTSSSFVIQDLFEGGYAKPFLQCSVTYLNTAAFSLYLVPFFLREWWTRKSQDYESIVNDEPTVHASSTDLPPLTRQETIKLASVFCFFWFIANWSINLALDYTSVASSTILSSTSGFFTMIVGRICGVEQLNSSKIAAVFMSFAGVIIVSLSDSSKNIPMAEPHPSANPHRLFGDSLALLSAIFYALYSILVKVRVKKESRINLRLFFGYVGLFNVLFCWPIGVLLHLVGLEQFQLPSTSKQIAALCLTTFVTFSSDYLYVLAMMKTTPLVVTVGLSLTIPLAVVGDIFLNKAPTLSVISGALLVCVGFVVIGIGESNTSNVE